MQLNYGPFSSSKNLRRLCRAEVHLQSHDFVVCRGAFSRPPRKSHLSGQPQPFRCWYHVVTIGTRPRAFTKKNTKAWGLFASFNTWQPFRRLRSISMNQKKQDDEFDELFSSKVKHENVGFFFMSAHASSTASQAICSKFQKKELRKIDVSQH